MNEQIRAWYLGLQDTSQQVFLALVSNSLTVDGRGFGLYLSGEAQVEAFKGLNELQHQLSGHIAAIGLARDRYPDEVLWAILHEKAAHYGILGYLTTSLEFARSRSCRSEPG
jgi:hypothetical protein